MSGSRVKLKSKRPESLREGLGSSSGDMQRLKNPIPFGLQSYLLSFGGTGVGASRLQTPEEVLGALGSRISYTRTFSSSGLVDVTFSFGLTS